MGEGGSLVESPQTHKPLSVCGLTKIVFGGIIPAWWSIRGVQKGTLHSHTDEVRVAKIENTWRES